jgi:hypothetical protein
MSSLCGRPPIEIEILLGRRYDPAAEEAVMLDFAFVALGFAIIGLMGLYAAGLRRL